MIGATNIYTCQVCGKSIVTVDVHEGTTPFMTKCWETDGCPGPMVSAGYRVPVDCPPPQWEWYRPSLHKLRELDFATQDHVRRGGLILRLRYEVKP